MSMSDFLASLLQPAFWPIYINDLFLQLRSVPRFPNSHFLKTTTSVCFCSVPTLFDPSFSNQLEKGICVSNLIQVENGETQLEALLAKLLHNEREREVEEESTAFEPGKPSPTIRAEAEAFEIEFQLQIKWAELCS